MQKRQLPLVIFFLITGTIGLFAVKDYGISWDEPIQRAYGQKVFSYVFKENTKLLTSKERYYGPAFEFFLILLEKSLSLTNVKDIYQMRHLAAYLFFCTSLIFFYLLNKELFNRKIALLGILFLFVTPRIFADSFYNSKDIPFMSMFIISVYFIYKLFTKPSSYAALAAGVLAGILTDIRIAGILGPILGIAAALLGTSKNVKTKMKLVGLFAATCLLSIYTFWPTLWVNPIKNFVGAFNQMAKYPHETGNLYFGQQIQSTKVPWHFIPGWMLVTVPVSLTALFLVGLGSLFINYEDTKKLSLILLWLFGSLLPPILFKSAFYNAWRQMFFIYPAFITIVCYGLYKLNRAKKSGPKYLVYSLVALDMLAVVYFNIRWHPHQNVYFNLLAGSRRGIEKRFDLDYWGLSYKQAYDYILRINPRKNILVSAKNFPGENNIFMSNQPERLVFIDGIGGDYYLTYETREDLPYILLSSVIVDGYRILDIYKLR